MAFPSNPSHLAPALVNGVNYVYDSTTVSWSPQSSTNTLTIGSLATFSVSGNASVLGTFGIGTSNPTQTLTVSGSVGATIFYDLDDTAYYTNPNGTSNMYTAVFNNAAYSYNWWRSYNATGWYNETYGGGVWMTDSTYVRVYNGKSFLVESAAHMRIGSGEANEKQLHFYNDARSVYFFQQPVSAGSLFGLYDLSGSFLRWGSDTSGNFLNYYSIRAPIFYDTDNTGYFCNPNGLSYFSTLQVLTETQYPGSMNSDWASGYYHFGPTNDTPNSGYGHGRVQRLDGNWTVQEFWSTGDSTGYWWRQKLNGTWGSWLRTLWDGATYKTINYLYSNIIYDANDSAYYVDPTANIKIAGQMYIGGWYRSYGDQGWYNETYGGGIYMSDTTWVRVYGSKRFWASGIIQSDTDVRTPIFYDNDDTYYRIDPNGQSQLSYVKANNWFRAQGQTGLYSESYGQHIYPTTDGRLWNFTTSGQTSGGLRILKTYEGEVRGYLYWDGDENFGLLHKNGGWNYRGWTDGFEAYGYWHYQTRIQAYIYYDRDDTGYYCDPNGYSSMSSMRLWGNNLYIRGGSPTIFFQDVDHYSAMIHNNSHLLYILRGGVDSTTWATTGPSYWWPCYWDLTNNNCVMGGYFSNAYDITAWASDRRLKENIVEITNAIDKIKQIRGVTFDWNDIADDAGFRPVERYNNVGVIAQEIQAVLPQAVKPAPFDKWVPDPGEHYSDEVLTANRETSRTGEDYLTVQMEKIIPLLIQAIKEQQTQIENLQSRLDQINP